MWPYLFSLTELNDDFAADPGEGAELGIVLMWSQGKGRRMSEYIETQIW